MELLGIGAGRQARCIRLTTTCCVSGPPQGARRTTRSNYSIVVTSLSTNHLRVFFSHRVIIRSRCGRQVQDWHPSEPPTVRLFAQTERPIRSPHRDLLRGATYDVRAVGRKRDNPVNFPVDNRSGFAPVRPSLKIHTDIARPRRTCNQPVARSPTFRISQRCRKLDDFPTLRD